MNIIIQNILNDLNININKDFIKFKNDINKLYLGRANPSILKNLKINCPNNISTPLYKLAYIIIKDNNTIKLTVYDSKIIQNINKAILKSNLGVTPIIKGNNVIYVNIQAITLESKNILIKFIMQQTEAIKVSVRNARRKANELLKNNQKNKQISKDEEIVAKSKIQKYIDNIILNIDSFIKQKINYLIGI